MPANILNFSSYVVTTLVENEHDYHIVAEAKEHPSTCQICGIPDVVGFGRNKQLVRFMANVSESMLIPDAIAAVPAVRPFTNDCRQSMPSG
jgi:hypothetical protein